MGCRVMSAVTGTGLSPGGAPARCAVQGRCAAPSTCPCGEQTSHAPGSAGQNRAMLQQAAQHLLSTDTTTLKTRQPEQRATRQWPGPHLLHRVPGVVCKHSQALHQAIPAGTLAKGGVDFVGAAAVEGGARSLRVSVEKQPVPAFSCRRDGLSRCGSICFLHSAGCCHIGCLH